GRTRAALARGKAAASRPLAGSAPGALSARVGGSQRGTGPLRMPAARCLESGRSPPGRPGGRVLDRAPPVTSAAALHRDGPPARRSRVLAGHHSTTAGGAAPGGTTATRTGGTRERPARAPAARATGASPRDRPLPHRAPPAGRGRRGDRRAMGRGEGSDGGRTAAASLRDGHPGAAPAGHGPQRSAGGAGLRAGDRGPPGPLRR